MKKQLDIIQVYRGIAALMVVVHHVVPSLGYFQNFHYSWIDFFASLGKYGVDFFFILSGFVINYSNAYKTENNVAKFVKNRIIRIYVPYLPVGVGLYFLYLLLPSLSQNPRNISLLTSFTLIPHGSPALAVAWTLSFEMFFYLIYSLCLINKRVWNIFLTFWVLLIIGVNSAGLQFTSPILELFFSWYNLEFVLGYVLSLLVVTNIVLNRGIIILLSLLFFCSFVLAMYLSLSPYPFFINSVFSLFSFFLIYYSIVYRNVKLKHNNFLMLIGNSSYSLYLIHGPLHAFIERYLPQTESLIVYMFYIFIVVVICVLVGFFYYKIFEKYFIKVVKDTIFESGFPKSITP
ncbi:acyltransferase [Pseudopedobacter sp.]|uniref:acyltransferase family protein n=1 Tax=Pseudopedobacter sp. TaxID=1936787 RepID=UPI003340F640